MSAAIEFIALGFVSFGTGFLWSRRLMDEGYMRSGTVIHYLGMLIAAVCEVVAAVRIAGLLS